MTVHDGTGPDALFRALSDPDCRRLLSELGSGSMTAIELADAADIPRSTVYRKLDRLTGAGLIEETIRIRPAGPNSAEYALGFHHLAVRVAPDGSLEIERSRRADR